MLLSDLFSNVRSLGENDLTMAWFYEYRELFESLFVFGEGKEILYAEFTDGSVLCYPAGRYQDLPFFSGMGEEFIHYLRDFPVIMEQFEKESPQ